jgi:hypothetical protein
LFYHRHFFRSNIIPLSKFNKIKAVAVNGILDISEGGKRYWNHHIVLVLPNEKMVRITDTALSNLETYNALGTQLSELFECPFYPGRNSNVFVNKSSDYSAVILYKKQNFLRTYLFEIVISIAAFIWILTL